MNAAERMTFTERLALGIEYEIKDLPVDEKRLVVAFLAGWFNRFLKGEEL